MDHGISKEVMVKIESLIVDDAGEKTEMTLYTEARYQNRGNKAYLMYQESEVSGMEGVKTLLTHEADRVIIKRYGSVNSELTLRLDAWHENIYKTPYGLFNMRTYGKQLQWKDAPQLEIALHYALELENGDVSEVHVNIVSQGE